MNLERMTARELRMLRDRIDVLIKTRHAAQAAAIRKQCEDMARAAGTSLGEIFARRQAGPVRRGGATRARRSGAGRWLGQRDHYRAKQIQRG